jgi:uracil-DNA glycosylase
VFMLWGGYAQKKAPLIGPMHLVLMANHPSPLAALRPPQPFIGCGHFAQANDWLAARGLNRIAWITHPTKKALRAPFWSG